MQILLPTPDSQKPNDNVSKVLLKLQTPEVILLKQVAERYEDHSM